VSSLAPARRDLALDLVANNFPQDTAALLRARDAASARDPALRFLAVRHFPRLVQLYAARGDAAALRDLLARGSCINPSVCRNAALREASAMGWAEVVDALLADARVASGPRADAIVAASANGHAAVTARLLHEHERAETIGASVILRVLKRAVAEGDGATLERLAGGAFAAPAPSLLSYTSYRHPPTTPWEDFAYIAARFGWVDILARALVEVSKEERPWEPRALDVDDCRAASLPWGCPAHSTRRAALDVTARALREACRGGHVELVSSYLDAGFDPSAQRDALLLAACEGGRSDLLARVLADARVKPAAVFGDAIRAIAPFDRVPVLEILLACPGVDPSANDNEALRVVSWKGAIGMLNRLLADPRADPSARENEALREAARQDFAAVVERLLKDPRVDPSARRDEAMRKALR
jgi:hypothetical protein